MSNLFPFSCLRLLSTPARVLKKYVNEQADESRTDRFIEKVVPQAICQLLVWCGVMRVNPNAGEKK